MIFLGFIVMPYFLQRLKNCFKWKIWSSLFVSTATSELSNAKVFKMKSFSKLVLLREGTWAIVALMLLKATFYVSVHLNCTIYFTICCKGFTISANSGTNLRTKFIVPINDCIASLLWGKGIWNITSIRSGAMEIPFFEIIWPNSFPSRNAKWFSLYLKICHIFYSDQKFVLNEKHDRLFF